MSDVKSPPEPKLIDIDSAIGLIGAYQQEISLLRKLCGILHDFERSGNGVYIDVILENLVLEDIHHKYITTIGKSLWNVPKEWGFVLIKMRDICKVITEHRVTVHPEISVQGAINLASRLDGEVGQIMKLIDMADDLPVYSYVDLIFKDLIFHKVHYDMFKVLPLSPSKSKVRDIMLKHVIHNIDRKEVAKFANDVTVKGLSA